MKIVEKIGAIFFATVLTATAASAQAIKHVAANGLRLAYVEAGSGPPVVQIHGSVSDYREWSKQMKPLARHYHVIAYSRRYHWPNAAPTANADASLEVQVEDLAAIIKTLKIAPAHVVGHSYGGAVALQLALRHPELVRTLVLAEPAVASVLTEGPEDEAARNREGQANRIAMKEAFASGDPERIVRTIAADVAPGVYEKAGPDVRQMLLDNVPAFQLDYNSRRLPFTCDVAKKITAPALILAGERSPLGLQRIAEKTANCLKSAQFVRIPDATHWIPHDQPQKFSAALLDFLANHKEPDKLVQRVDPVGQFSSDRFEVIEYPNAISTIGSAINKRGDIVGRIDLPGGKVVGFVFRKKKFELIEVPGAEFTYAQGINDHGHITGASRQAGGRNTGYILKDRAFTSFTFPGAERTLPFKINSQGDSVGSYERDGRTRGFLRRRSGEFISLDYPGAILTYATGINDRGEIVGRWDSADGREHGFHWLDGVFKILDVPDAIQTLPDGINDRGDVVGRTTTANGSVLAFYRRDGMFQTFGYPGARIMGSPGTELEFAL